MLKVIAPINNVSIADLKRFAKKTIEEAPNSDWRNNGEITLVGNTKTLEVKIYDWKDFKEVPVANATVAFFKFEKPNKSMFDEDRLGFIGFTLAVMCIGKKQYYEASPVIGEVKDEDYESPLGCFSNRFCPQCHFFDSVKRTSRRAGPECIHVTYSCKKCDYVDHDVMD